MKNKDQILLENAYLRIHQEDMGFRPQYGGGTKHEIDEIRIGNDIYSATYDFDLNRSVEQHGTFYDEPRIDVLSVSKYDPNTDESMEIPVDRIDRGLMDQIKDAISNEIDSGIDNDQFNFYNDEPDHPDI
jgi:hypothetical protein